MILSWSFGFYRPYIRDSADRLTFRGIFGHCDAWACTVDDTWLFIDPQAEGTKIVVTHLYDEVMAQLEARHSLCEAILTLEPTGRQFSVPLHPGMTCAAICGSLVGIRALRPSTLKRRLLAIGAEKVK